MIPTGDEKNTTHLGGWTQSITGDAPRIGRENTLINHHPTESGHQCEVCQAVGESTDRYLKRRASSLVHGVAAAFQESRGVSRFLSAGTNLPLPMSKDGAKLTGKALIARMQRFLTAYAAARLSLKVVSMHGRRASFHMIRQ